MDELRRIRFFIPPFIFFLSLFWGAHLSGATPFPDIETSKDLFTLAATLAASAIPLGFLISIISITLLRLLFFISHKGTYEASLSPDALQRVGKRISTGCEMDNKWELYGVATFDHEVLNKGVHEWIARRWTMFNLSAHSITAILMSYLFALPLKIPLNKAWFYSGGIIMVILIINAIASYRHTMKMMEFQSYRKNRPVETTDEEKPLA